MNEVAAPGKLYSQEHKQAQMVPTDRRRTAAAGCTPSCAHEAMRQN